MKNLTLTIFLLLFISCNQRSSENTEKMKKDSVVTKIDTLVANNYVLTFEKTDSFKRSDIFGDFDYRSNLTKNIDNSFDKAVIVQKYLSEKFNDYFLNLYQIMLVISMFFIIQVVLASDTILYYALGSESFSSEKIEILYIVIISFLGMFLGGILSSVLVNAFYSKGLTSLVSKMSIILHALGIVVKIVAFKLYGFYALAIVMSIKSIIGSILLVWLYNIYIYK